MGQLLQTGRQQRDVGLGQVQSLSLYPPPYTSELPDQSKFSATFKYFKIEITRHKNLSNDYLHKESIICSSKSLQIIIQHSNYKRISTINRYGN